MLQYLSYIQKERYMSILSFLVGAVVGGVAMKLYNDQQKDAFDASHEHCDAVCEEKIEAPESVEFTSDGIIEVEPSDEELIITAISALKKAKSRVSIASVSRESGLSTYKVGKHKKLIDKAKK